MTQAVVGRSYAKLDTRFIEGDPWDPALILKSGGVPVAWPSAPVWEFGEDLSDADGDDEDANPFLAVTATLDPDPETSTTDARASWSMTREVVKTIPAGMPCRLRIDGRTVAKGRARCLS